MKPRFSCDNSPTLHLILNVKIAIVYNTNVTIFLFMKMGSLYKMTIIFWRDNVLYVSTKTICMHKKTWLIVSVHISRACKRGRVVIVCKPTLQTTNFVSEVGLETRLTEGGKYENWKSKTEKHGHFICLVLFCRNRLGIMSLNELLWLWGQWDRQPELSGCHPLSLSILLVFKKKCDCPIENWMYGYVIQYINILCDIGTKHFAKFVNIMNTDWLFKTALLS